MHKDNSDGNSKQQNFKGNDVEIDALNSEIMESNNNQETLPFQNQNSRTIEINAKTFKGFAYSMKHQSEMKRDTIFQHCQPSNLGLDHKIHDNSAVPHSNS